MKKTLLFLTIALALILGFTACSNKTGANTSEKIKSVESTLTPSIKAIKEKGKLVLGTSADYPPYEFKALVNGKLEIVGFEIEMAKKIAEKLGVELEIKNMDFKLLIEALKQGQVDLILSGISPTPERAEEIGLSSVFYTATQSVLIREEDKDIFTSIDSLKGKNLGAQMGTIQVELAKAIEGTTVKELPVMTSLILDLETKKIDAIVVEQPVAKQYASSNKGLFSPDFIFEEANDGGGSVAGVKKENADLLEFIDNTIIEMKNDGSIDKWVVEAMELSSSSAE